MRTHQGHVLFSSKTPTPIFDSSPTPELPLLEEAANELAGFDDFQLLPSAAVDCEQPWGCESTPATTLPASPEGDSSEEQAFPTDLEDLQGAVTFWPGRAASFSWNHNAAPWQPQERLHQQADGSMDFGDQMQYSDFGQGGKRETYVLMWCRIDYEDGIARVTPICDDNAASPPDDAAYYMHLWCYTTEILGDKVIVPCTKNGSVAENTGENTNWPPAPPSVEDLKTPGCERHAEPAERAPTTLMLCGLPSEVTQDDLLEVLDREEFNGVYDFVYLQDDLRNDSNERYALVNLVAHKYGLALAARLHNKTSWGVGECSDKCTVAWSPFHQGFDELVQMFRDRLEHDPNAPPPQPFSGGWPIDLP